MTHSVILFRRRAQSASAGWLGQACTAEKAADHRAGLVFLPYQKMPASVVNDQFRTGNLACGELSSRQRIEAVVPRRDDQRRRSDSCQRQFMQVRGTIDIDTGSAETRVRWP